MEGGPKDPREAARASRGTTNDHFTKREDHMKRAFVALLLILLATPTAPFWPRGTSAQEKKEEAAADKEKQDKKDLPLEPVRDIVFDTTEGSWISVDVAPDGRSLVFELVGDLYSLPIDGGIATRIASGMTFDSQPRFSPDGSKIVFLSDRSGDENVWIANKDGGEPKAITKGRIRATGREWTPDGNASSCRVGNATTGTQLWRTTSRGTGVNLTGSEERRQLNRWAPPLAKTIGLCTSPSAQLRAASTTRCRSAGSSACTTDRPARTSG
jgi:dipeptidyl aminopeptidase/acylaminoacyl peptidase